MILKQVVLTTNIIFGILLLLWLPSVPFSVFMLDDPSAEGGWNLLRNYHYYSWLAYPLFWLAGLVTSRYHLRV